MTKTEIQYKKTVDVCHRIFMKKAIDYGTAWRVLRPSSLTDQLLIKAQRIRSIEEKGVSKIAESVRDEFIGIVNYAVMALIQLENGTADSGDMSPEKAEELYLKFIELSKELMMNKNHDYDEAWRSMRVSSYTDLILMKIFRTKQIEDNKGKTLISEGVDANYYDMINYAVFGLIKIDEAEENKNV
jgi:hypothetical protein